eukprot:5597368-Pyramimonas_sp.AAC.1
MFSIGWISGKATPAQGHSCAQSREAPGRPPGRDAGRRARGGRRGGRGRLRPRGARAGGATCT